MTLSFAAIGVFLGGLGPALGVDSSTVRTAGATMMIAFAPVLGATGIAILTVADKRLEAWVLTWQPDA